MSTSISTACPCPNAFPSWCTFLEVSLLPTHYSTPLYGWRPRLYLWSAHTHHFQPHNCDSDWMSPLPILLWLLTLTSHLSILPHGLSPWQEGRHPEVSWHTQGAFQRYCRLQVGTYLTQVRMFFAIWELPALASAPESWCYLSLLFWHNELPFFLWGWTFPRTRPVVWPGLLIPHFAPSFSIAVLALVRLSLELYIAWSHCHKSHLRILSVEKYALSKVWLDAQWTSWINDWFKECSGSS